MAEKHQNQEEIIEAEEIVSSGDENQKSSTFEARFSAFVKSNQRNLAIAGGVIVLGIAYFLFTSASSAEKEEEASDQMYRAVEYFEKDSLNLALNGDGQNSGLLDVADEYGSTKTGNLAKFYIGCIYLKQNKLEDAKSYFEDFKSSDDMVSAACYAALASIAEQEKEFDKAAGLYQKASDVQKNKFTSPQFLADAARCYESAENYASALRLYEYIKKEYPDSQEGSQIEKYITRVQAKMNS
jgi:tetratricopeptide (TPR) repeat protein